MSVVVLRGLEGSSASFWDVIALLDSPPERCGDVEMTWGPGRGGEEAAEVRRE